MRPVFAKLNLKGRNLILVVNTPQSFESDLADLEGAGIARDVEEVGEAISLSRSLSS